MLRIQQQAKTYAYGFVLGIPLTFGGAHYGVTRTPVGFAATAVGLVAVAVGLFAMTRMRALKQQLRLITPDAWRSPAAHLPGARKAATLAAYLNGVLVLLSSAPRAICSTRAPDGARTATRSASAPWCSARSSRSAWASPPPRRSRSCCG